MGWALDAAPWARAHSPTWELRFQGHTHVYSTGLRRALVFSALWVPAGPGHMTVGAVKPRHCPAGGRTRGAPPGGESEQRGLAA